MNKPIELTTTIDPHAFPRLYTYLLQFESGRPRAAVLKRLAEDYLHAREQADAPAPTRTTGTSEQTPVAHDRKAIPFLPDKALVDSLRQFQP
jgi:hypothetical protein